MRYEDISDLGGFLWWLIIRFARTNLEDEQTKEHWARNIFFLIILVFIAGFISVKVIK